MTNTKNEVPDFEKMAELFFTGLSPHVAEKAKGFFKGSFFKQGFTDQSFIAWPQRKDDQTWGHTHKILTQSHFLRDSIIIAQATKDVVEIEAGRGVPYAAIHNTGGIIKVRVTAKSRKFFWWVYLSLTKHYAEGINPPPHILKWKKMALTKKSHLTIKMPQRQYIGDSMQLLKEIDQYIVNKIKEAQAAVMP